MMQIDVHQSPSGSWLDWVFAHLSAVSLTKRAVAWLRASLGFWGGVKAYSCKGKDLYHETKRELKTDCCAIIVLS